MFISNDWEPILNHEFNQEYMKELFKQLHKEYDSEVVYPPKK